MIKQGEVAEVPEVELGRLVKCLQYPYYARENYPRIQIARRTDEGVVEVNCSFHVGPVPDGYFVYKQYDTPEEELADYAAGNRDDHADITDERMREAPYGCFHGRGRNRRWCDEYDRRNL